MYVAVVLGLGEVVFVVAFVVIVDGGGGGCSKMHVLYDIFYFKSLKGSKKEEAVLLYNVLYILIKALVNQGIFSFKCSS